jgi:hypothetical protein
LFRVVLKKRWRLATLLNKMHLSGVFLNEEWRGMKKLALAALLLAMTGSSAFAGGGEKKCNQFLFWSFCPEPTHKHTVAAPEIDPASALAALSLMAGGLAVLRGRRSKGTAV